MEKLAPVAPDAPSEASPVFVLDRGHVGIEIFGDLAGQIAWSHRWITADGRLTRHCAPCRYLWPPEAAR